MHRPKGLETQLEFLFVVALKLSPFTKDFRGGELLWVRSVFFETLLTAELHWNVQKQSEFDCLPTSSGRTCSWSFSVFAAFAVHASRLHIYLAIWTDRAFLHIMGSKTLDMLSLGVWPKQRSLQRLKAHQRLVYLYQQKLQGIGGSMVEFSPATWEIRVQFPANARTASFQVRCGLAQSVKMLKLQELKRSLFGPNPKEIIRFLRCGYLCSETQETISVHKMALKRLPFISQLFNCSVGRNCSSSCLPQDVFLGPIINRIFPFLNHCLPGQSELN